MTLALNNKQRIRPACWVSTDRGAMKQVLSVLAVAVAVSLLSACASGIVVTRLGANEPTATGNPWNLGMTQFKITITRHIVECGKVIKGGVEILASPTMVLDEQQRYALVSNGWWATSDITSNLAPTGISTGLNASSTDATATALSSAIGAVAQVAIGLAAGAAPDPAAVNVKPPPLCQPEVAKAVSELYPEKSDPPKIGLKQVVDRDIAALASATAKITLLTSQSAVDSTLKKQLAASMGEQAKLQERLNASQALLTSYLNLTTETQVVSWPKSAGEFRRDSAYNVDDLTLDKWTTGFADRPAARGKFAIYLALYRQNSVDGSWSEPPLPAVSDVKIGVPVRLARVGRLLACVGAKCPPALAEVQAKDTARALIGNDFVVLQLGQLYNVPLTGGTFKAETAVVAMDANGLPTSIQVSEKAAAGAVLAGAAKDAATQFAALPAQLRAAELAKTTAQTSQLTANAALSAAEANAAAQGETSTLAAQLALVNARNALEQAKANAGLPLQTAAVSAQAALLSAQTALATAQANASISDRTSVIGAQTTLINAQTAQINAAAALAKAQLANP